MIVMFSARRLKPGTEDDYRRWRAEADAEEMQRVDHLSAFVESQAVEGVHEVIDVIDE
ncbi:MAG TPA: hypothetical protein VK486_17190 [Thermoleophilaceae bacterium]|nr:hypothetical protein [Thermoleophilaceae bacterium]